MQIWQQILQLGSLTRSNIRVPVVHSGAQNDFVSDSACMALIEICFLYAWVTLLVLICFISSRQDPTWILSIAIACVRGWLCERCQAMQHHLHAAYEALSIPQDGSCRTKGPKQGSLMNARLMWLGDGGLWGTLVTCMVLS